MKPIRADFETSIALLIIEFILGFKYSAFFKIFGINLVLFIIQILIRVYKDRW